ncbi:TolC family protein, partial [Escherichia coli]|nr:TolC family protein [Escherichia coli]
LNKAQYDYDSAVINASQAAKSALLKVTGGLSQVQALQTAVQSSELALKANKTGYEVGVRINIDVLNAQQQLSSAERD